MGKNWTCSAKGCNGLWDGVVWESDEALKQRFIPFYNNIHSQNYEIRIKDTTTNAHKIHIAWGSELDEILRRTFPSFSARKVLEQTK